MYRSGEILTSPGESGRMSVRLRPDAGAVEAFKQAIEAIDDALGGQALNRDVVKTQGFTDAVKAAAKARAAGSP
jgi:hypothetical protein